MTTPDTTAPDATTLELEALRERIAADLPDFLEDLAEDLDVRHPHGWGPETGLLLVSGGSHAGNATGAPRGSRFTPGRRVHLIPLEPIAADSHATFAVVPPWLKEVWRDPEAEGTG